MAPLGLNPIFREAKAPKQGNNIFNLKSFNSLKKDQTKIKIFKNSSFDSSFNSVQSLNTNLSNLLILPSSRVSDSPLSSSFGATKAREKGGTAAGTFKEPSPALAGAVNKNISFNNIISKNILLRNMKYNFLKSTLSIILKKKIKRISEILEDKSIKNYVLYSYLNFCIFTPPHLNVPGALEKQLSPSEGGSFLGCSPSPMHEAEDGIATPICLAKGGRSKLSLNKYKGRKFGSFIKYNQIIEYKFKSTFYQALSKSWAPFTPSALALTQPKSLGLKVSPLGSIGARGELEKNRGNIYIKDIYKLLFYLFKSMYCLISKPVLKYTNDKVTIQLFYYLNIPKKKVFRLFAISYINSIKKKWLAHIDKKKTNFISPSLFSKEISKEKRVAAYAAVPAPALAGLQSKGEGRAILPRGNSKIYIRWKLRKAISRLKNKNIPALAQATLGGKNLFFKLRKFNLTAKAVFQNKFKLICAILSNKFNKPVELQLIRLHHPYHDSNILVNLLSLNIKNKRKKARVAIQKIYNKKPVKNLNDPNLKKIALPTAESLDFKVKTRGAGFLTPAFLSGLNIKIAGRLMGEPIIPRITTKNYGKGASAIGKVNYLDVARITKKNRKGAYTIKITSGQNFF